MRTVVVAVLLGLGIAVSASGAVGILRMPDPYLRIQASAKSVVLGALPVLLGLVVAEGLVSVYAARALLVAVLLMVMSPMASHALARAAYQARVPMWRGAVTDEPARRQR